MPLSADGPADLRVRALREHRLSRKALITGITGQDGAYLAELLLERDMSCMASDAVPHHLI